jgi:5-methylcytosine-specific restriction enzyme subunit McrC
MTFELFQIQEHNTLNNEQINCLSNLNIPLSNNNKDPKYLGLSTAWNVGYYIGAKWIKENEFAIIVNPKIKDLDYLKMFMYCFNNPTASREISKIYEIDFDKSPIKIPSNTFELTPLIIIHFLNLVKKIVKKGLKRDYVWVQNNLNSKIKGKVLINQNVKQNIIKARPDRTYCKYQEYSKNCLENKLIKKTLDFVFTYLKSHYSKNKELLNLFYFNYTSFANISNDVDIINARNIKTNSLYKEYNETLKIAKIILRRFDYSIQNTKKNEKEYPPFHIDMSLLFELYVYSKLQSKYGKDILFQYHGGYGDIDFVNVNEKTIIDTKYKSYYNENFTGQAQWKRDNIAKDIRQLSGYSRDVKVLKKLNFNLEDNLPILDCVIIYPDQNSDKTDVENLVIKSEKINEFYKFYKYGIRLPEKQRNANIVYSAFGG